MKPTSKIKQPNTLRKKQSNTSLMMNIESPINSFNQIILKNPNIINSIDNKDETLLSYAIKRKKVNKCQIKNNGGDKNGKKSKNKKTINVEAENVDNFPESFAKNLEVTENNRSSTKPCVVRLEYKSCYNQDKGGNVAYCLSNKLPVEDSIKPATKEIFEKYTQLTTLNTPMKILLIFIL